jgi:hypothetical protein
MNYRMTETSTSANTATATATATSVAHTAIVHGEALSRGWGSSVSHSSQTVQQRIDEHIYGIKGWGCNLTPGDAGGRSSSSLSPSLSHNPDHIPKIDPNKPIDDKKS